MSALDGIRVVDFGQWIAGPLAAMLLADHGADVVHVDPPGGPRWRTPANATWNRGKRHVVLDLACERDRAAARALVAEADVVVENFRPGVMARLGLGPLESMRAHPRLIYCSLPGFAADDPRAAMPAWEGVVAAATGGYAEPAAPRFTAIPVASSFAALAGAVAIVMALIARERDGLGQRIEVPLFDAMFLAIGASGLLIDGRPDGGARPDDPWGGQFECADGRWVRVSLATFRFLERFVAAAGRTDWIDRGWVERERPGRLARGTALRAQQDAEFVALFKSRPAAEWEALGLAAGVPITLIRTSAEWLAAPHPNAAGSVVDVVDPELGAMRQPGLAVRMLGTPGTARPRAQHTHAAADGSAAGASARSGGPARAHPAGAGLARAAALDGIRVIDLTQVLAGPTAARTLAEFGADVVKINNPREEGAGYRWQVHRYHTDVNRGKRTILLDLKSPDGLDVFRRLAAGADVVLQNFRPGVADRLGVGYEQVRGVSPGVVYGTVGFLGEGGPWAAAPGYEPNAQAASGMMARMAGAAGVPAMQPYAVNDYATGLLGALGLGLALFHRRRAGAGQHVQTSLAAAATLLQSAYLPSLAGKGLGHGAVAAVAEPVGPEALGWGPLQRLYRASDAWLFLGAAAPDLARLNSVPGLEGVEGLDGGALAEALATRLEGATAAEWVARLTAAGVGAQALRSAPSLMRDPWAVAHGLSITHDHESGARVTTIGPPARLSGTPVAPGRPVRLPGRDAADVLARVGLEHRLADLAARGAIALE